MAENTGEKQRGKPFKPGQSGNPAGKPPGAKNKATIMAQALFDGEAEILTRTIIEFAKKGDMQALKICIDRLCPPMKAQAAPVQVEIPESDKISDMANAFIRAAAEGKLPPDVAAQLVSAVGTLARVVEIDELKERLTALETAVGRN
ncbi:hypothetical protein FCL47_08835 [Desulfopila sp. IMCC35006]|uniref:DUF5681 domain-containing protein n=1 Tax=Desulfopila sp. IMCC35006 TaxID=2569542 RepID=UPI0010AC7F9C|nr:DUF5681 domain-containing protein [Desulfopila sp. IMCC35006]TKB26509.1 hypothetical protein FCL47_08835 [Desulfopila sp. IMCC35006]